MRDDLKYLTKQPSRPIVWILSLIIIVAALTAYSFSMPDAKLAKCHTVYTSTSLLRCSTGIPKTAKAYNKMRKSAKRKQAIAEADDNYYLSGILEGGKP
jgi:hypothetical protein